MKGNLYGLSDEQALLVMSGGHTQPDLLLRIYFHPQVSDEMVTEGSNRLLREAFISPACPDSVVHMVVDLAMIAKNVKEPSAEHQIYQLTKRLQHD